MCGCLDPETLCSTQTQGPGYEYPVWCRCRDHPGCNVDSYAVHVVCACFHLADMRPSAHAETYSGQDFDNRRCTAQRPRRTIERNEKTVTQRLDLATAEPSDLSPDELIMTGQEVLPRPITELTRTLRGLDDVGKQNGCQHAMGRNSWPCAGQELLDLIVQTMSVADERVIISRQLDVLRIGKMTGQATTRPKREAMPYSNPSIDTLAVVISVGHRISVRPFATAIFCVPSIE